MLEEDYYCSNNDNLYTKNWFIEKDIIINGKTKNLFLGLLKLKSHTFLKKIVWKKKYFLIIFKYPKRTIFLKEYNDKETNIYNLYDTKIISGKSIILCKGEKNDSFDYVLKNLEESLETTPISKIFKSMFLDEESIIRTKDKTVLKNKIDLEKHSSYFSSWGSKEAKLWFMAPDIIKKYTLPSYLNLKYNENLCIIQHGDFECLKMGGEGDSPFGSERIHFVDIPRPKNYEYEMMNLLGKKDMAMTFEFIENINNSVLYDKDIIMGGIENLRKVIKKINKRNPDSDILMMSACTPFIIGDDIRLLHREMSKKIKKVLMYKDAVRTNLYEDYFKEIKKIVDKDKSKKKKATINMVGFQKNLFFFEILKLLNVLGISINKSCLPNISKENFLKYKSAELQVLFSSYNYEWVYKQFFRKIDMPTISPNPPYGFYFTTEWIKTICNSLKIPYSKNRKWIQEYSALKKIYNKLKKEAKTFCLGLVVSEEDVKKIINPDYSQVSKITIIEQNQPSIPLINMLDDMGFKLDIVIISSKKEYFDVKKKIEKSFRNKHKISYCNDIDTLEEWINKKELNGIYSDFIFDKRITEHGKNRFSSDIYFEMGYEGAIRTLVRMLEVCKSNFNKKYHKFYKYPAKPIEIEDQIYG